jgi:protein-arginine kinase activator protein McsA
MKTKICSKCGENKKIVEFYYHRTRKFYMESCKTCNNDQSKKYQKEKRNEKDIKFILTQRAGSIRRDRKKYDIPVSENLSKILQEQWEKQNGRCFYTDEPLSIENYKKNNFYLTVDRKIPELGYVKDNVVLCCSIVNKIKTNLELNELFYWIEKIKNNLKN